MSPQEFRSFFQKLHYLFFSLFVCALANVIVNHITLYVYQVFSRPKSIGIGVPSRIIIVEHERKQELKLECRFSDIVYVFFKSKLRRVDADYLQALIFVFFIPCVQVWESSLTVYARIGHKIEQYHFFTNQISQLKLARIYKPGWIYNLFVSEQDIVFGGRFVGGSVIFIFNMALILIC